MERASAGPENVGVPVPRKAPFSAVSRRVVEARAGQTSFKMKDVPFDLNASP
jgi:hypothetical protein